MHLLFVSWNQFFFFFRGARSVTTQDCGGGVLFDFVFVFVLGGAGRVFNPHNHVRFPVCLSLSVAEPSHHTV